MFRRLQNNIRKASPMDAYAQVSDIAQEIQELVENGSSLIEREEKAIRNEMIETPAIRSLKNQIDSCLLYTSPSPRDVEESRMPSSA